MKNFILPSLLFFVFGVTATAQNNVPPEVREMARKVMIPVVSKVPKLRASQPDGVSFNHRRSA